jgi:hypothetical protein
VACPVAALKAWLAAGSITAGPIFRSVKKGGAVAGRLPAQSVADIVKTYAERVGLTLRYSRPTRCDPGF